MSEQKGEPSVKERGNAAFRSGNPQLAAELYTQALELEPTNATLFGNRSAAKLELGDNAGALSDAEQAIAINPTWMKGYHRKAAALARMGDPWGSYTAYCDARAAGCDSPWLVKKIRETRDGLGSAREGAIDSIAALLGRFRALPDPRERFSSLAHFWNLSSREERALQFSRLVSLISGQGGLGPAEEFMAEENMRDLPMENYSDLEPIAPFMDFFRDLDRSQKVEAMETLWHSLGDAEKGLVISDMKAIITGQAEAAAEDEGGEAEAA